MSTPEFNPAYPWAPFPVPVPVPGVDPTTAPLVCVQFNETWLAYVVGALGALTAVGTWSGTSADANLAATQGVDLQSLFASAIDGTACSLIIEFRIKPDFPCEAQYSLDGGLTWIDFPNIVACVPAPPDLSHFLVDNPGITRDNGIVAQPGHFAISATGFGNTAHPGTPVFGATQTGVAVVADFYAQNGTGESVLRLGRHFPDGGYLSLELDSEFVVEVIHADRTFSNPEFATLPTPDAKHLGVWALDASSGSARTPAICIEAGPGIYTWLYPTGSGARVFDAATTVLTPHAAPVLTVVDTGTVVTYNMELPPIEAPLTFAAFYTPLLPHATPAFTRNRIADTVSYSLDLPPIEAPLTFAAFYTPILPHATPAFTQNRTADTVSYSLDLPPIEAPLSFAAGFATLPAGSEPTFVASRTGDLVDYTLSLPPIPDQSIVCPNTSLPAVGGTRHYVLTVDATGTALPMLLPAGYRLENFTVSGLWLIYPLGTAVVSMFNGYGNIPAGRGPLGLYLAQLKLDSITASTNNAYDDPTDPFAAGFISTLDKYINFAMNAPQAPDGSGYGGTGQICIQFDILGLAPTGDIYMTYPNGTDSRNPTVVASGFPFILYSNTDGGFKNIYWRAGNTAGATDLCTDMQVTAQSGWSSAGFPDDSAKQNCDGSITGHGHGAFVQDWGVVNGIGINSATDFQVTVVITR